MKHSTARTPALSLLAGTLTACHASLPPATGGQDAAPAADAAAMKDAGPASSPDASPADAGTSTSMDAASERWPQDACFAACTGRWSLVVRDRPAFFARPYPSPVSPIAAVYDPTGHRLLLMGAPSDYVWSLPFAGPAANTWTILDDRGDPAPSIIRAATFDSARNRMIVLAEHPGFPGVHDPALYALDVLGTPTWQSIGGSLPPAANLGASIIFDAQKDGLLLIGGTAETFTSSASNPTTWHRIAVHGPHPFVTRFDEDTVIFDAARERLFYLSAGGRAYLLQLDAMGGGEWSTLPDLPERTAESHPGVYDPEHDRLVVFGGEGAFALALTATPAWTQVQASPEPQHRFGEAAIYDPESHRLVIAGGMTFDSNQPYTLDERTDVWALSLTSTPAWTELLPNDPRPAFASLPRGAMAYDDATSALLVIPSEYALVPGESVTLRTWRLALTASPAWTKLEAAMPPDPPRITDSLIPTGTPHRYLFVSTERRDTWSLDLDGPTWTEVLSTNTPKPAANGVLVPDRGPMLIATSSTSTGTVNAYVFAGVPQPAWKPLHTTGFPPSDRVSGSLIYDPPNRRLLLFGGEADDAEFPDLFVLDLATDPPTWSQIFLDGDAPGPSYGHSAVYDPVHRVMILIRGDYANNLQMNKPCGERADDLWVLNLDGPLEWARLQATGRFAVPAGPAAWAESGLFVFDSSMWRLDIDACR